MAWAGDARLPHRTGQHGSLAFFAADESGSGWQPEVRVRSGDGEVDRKALCKEDRPIRDWHKSVSNARAYPRPTVGSTGARRSRIVVHNMIDYE